MCKIIVEPLQAYCGAQFDNSSAKYKGNYQLTIQI